MIKKLSNYIAKKLINPDDESSKIDLYEYGLEIIIHKFLYTITLIIFCVFKPEFIIPSFIFTFCYFDIRKHTGGYHASKMIYCLLVFVILYFFMIYILHKSFELSNLIFYISCILNFGIILLLSPIDCSNKRLSEKEKSNNKKESILHFLLWMSVSIILFLFDYFYGYMPIIFSFYNISFFLILGYCFPK